MLFLFNVSKIFHSTKDTDCYSIGMSLIELLFYRHVTDWIAILYACHWL